MYYLVCHTSYICVYIYISILKSYSYKLYLNLKTAPQSFGRTNECSKSRVFIDLTGWVTLPCCIRHVLGSYILPISSMKSLIRNQPVSYHYTNEEYVWICKVTSFKITINQYRTHQLLTNIQRQYYLSVEPFMIIFEIKKMANFEIAMRFLDPNLLKKLCEASSTAGSPAADGGPTCAEFRTLFLLRSSKSSQKGHDINIQYILYIYTCIML